MGIWNGIKHGLVEGGSFLVENSGTMLETAKAVAVVAGVPSSSGAAELLADFLVNFRAANDYIIGAAETAAQNPPSAFAVGTADVQKDVLNGVWDMPAQSPPGSAPLPAYRDIATFLQASNIPMHVSTSQLSTIDVAYFIANEMFYNLQTPSNDPRGIQMAEFMISGPSGITIEGCHAYYPVTLGEASQNLALHSALVIHTTKTSGFRAAEATERRSKHNELVSSQSKPVVKANTSAASVNWVVTTSIEWTTVNLAQTYASGIQARLGSGLTVVDQQLYGCKEILKVLAAISFTPGSVKQAVIDAVIQIIQPPPPESPQPGGGGFAPADVQLPEVKVVSAVITTAQ